MGHFSSAAHGKHGTLVVLLAPVLLGLGALLPAQTTPGQPRLTREQIQMLQQAQRHAEQAGKALQQNKFSEAIAAWKKKLALEKKVWGSNHAQIVQSLQVLVRLYQDNDDYAAAVTALEDVRAIQTHRLGKSNWQLDDIQRDLASLRAAGRLPAAQRHQLREARQLNQRVLQLYGQGKITAAVPLAQRMVALRKEVLGEQHLDYAKALNNLATLYKDLGDFSRAEAIYDQARAITRGVLGTRHPTYANCLNNLALLYQEMGEHARAEPLLRQAQEIQKAVVGEKHPDYAQCLNNLAGLYWSQGAYEKAEPLFQKALLIAKQAYGETNPLYAAALTKLAGVFQGIRAYDKAEPLLQKALAVRKQALGEKHPEYLESLNALGWLHFHRGAYDRAELPFEKASRLTREAMGDKHPEYAATLNTLAWLFETRGQSDKAEPLLEKASGIYKKSLGTRHPDYAGNLNRLAWVYAGGKHASKAADTFDEARKSSQDHVLRVLPALPEAEQLTVLREEIQVGLYAAISLALTRPTSYELKVQAAGWLLNAKALAPAVLAEGALLARDQENVARARIIKDLATVRQQLAEATFAPLPPVPLKEKEDRTGKQPPREEPKAPPVPSEFTRRLEKISQLARREASLASQLGRPALYPGWLELTTVRKAIPINAGLIDLARVTRADFAGSGKRGRWKSAHYVAFLVPAFGKGKIELVDLGEADVLDTAVQELRRAFLAAPADIKDKGEIEAEQQLRGKLQVLSGLLIQPMSKQLGRYEHWIVSPDSSLWLVPWAALLVSDGRYALEKYQITYVTSGRDLVRAPGAGIRAQGLGKPLLLADPDYAEGKDVAKGTSREEPSSRLRFVEVPGSAAEAKALAPLVERYAGETLELATGKEARRRVFMAARKPRAVLLSAQGFFRADQDDAVAPLLLGQQGRNLKMIDPVLLTVDPNDRTRKVKVLENPLARCGLGLAGANRPPVHTTLAEDQDDGVLTGQDIASTDLRGTDLVLLTAGVPRSSPGRAGDAVGTLRQAFLLAGTRTVVDSLWPVPEQERLSLLMAFFENLAPRRTKSRALREAQRAIIQARRDKGKAAHPLYWAGLTLTGSWQ